MSKHQLLKAWPTPELVRDIASFVGLVAFYGMFIAHFELRIQRLRELMKLEYTLPLGKLFDEQAKAEFDDVRNAILSDPCIKRHDYRKRSYICTDFCAKGFAYVACQPGDDKPSMDAMRREMAGGECEFKKEAGTQLTLHPVALGSRKTRGKESKLHSYLGEGFAGDWAINKCRHMTWGMRFTWVTDCYGIRFILTYEGANPAVLRLQMRMMCHDCDIVHRNRFWIVDADYFSYLGADLCYDPLLMDHLQRASAMRREHPTPDTLPMMPENMPGFRGPRIINPETNKAEQPQVDLIAASLLTQIVLEDSNGHECLEHVPVQFGQFKPESVSVNLSGVRALYNNDLPLAAQQIARFSWAV